VKKGVPIRVEIGPRDVAAGKVCYARRDQQAAQKHFVEKAEFNAALPGMLAEIQHTLLTQARAYRHARTKEINSLEEFKAFFAGDDLAVHQGGFALCHFDETAHDHELLKELKVTPRCAPLAQEDFSVDTTPGVCLFSGKPSARRVIFAKSY
jgi:prolyl-tRNA synthetase